MAIDRDKLAKALGIDKETQNILDAGGSHGLSCRCETCRRWWQEMGPEDDPRRPYGPFAIDEIEDDTSVGRKCRQIREELFKSI